LSGGFNYRGERLAVEFVAARSEANYADETNGVTLTTHSPGLQVAINPSNGVPTFTFAEGYSPSDINSFHAIDIEYRPSETDTKEDQYKLDVDYDLNWAGFTRFEAGLQYRKSGSLRYRDSGSVVSTGADLVAGTADDIVTTNVRLGHSIAIGQAYTAVNQTGASINSINYTWLENDFRNVLREASTTLPSPYFDGYSDVSGLPSGWLVPDTAAILGYVDTSNFNRNNLRRAPGSDGNIYDQIPAHDIEEKITAGYAKLNFGHNWAGLDFTGNFGVRVVKTEVAAAGLLKRRERRSTPTQANPDATTTYEISNTIVSINESYTDVLPSFNLSTWIIPNELTVRFGVAKVLARPKMTDLVPAANCVFDATGGVILDDDFTDTCSAGNPNLDPYRATQYDLSGEWYPNRDTQVSIGLFYKDVTSYVVGRKLFTGVDYFSDGNLVDVTMPYNGQGAKLKGVEVAAKTAFTFLPGIWSGFGIDTNYTWSQADEVGLYSELDGAELPFPGLSEHSYNVTLWYDKGPLNARLAYNGRSEYLVTAAERSGNPVFRDGSEYLDAKATWRVNEGLSFFVEGKNLTNTAERSTSGSIRLNELAWPGQRYFFGVTYKR
ncbi:MAG: TonB-dependent receptor, partial [Asticcacaulis sp.]